jgi:hypothetical protein
LDERGILPTQWMRAFDARVDREERRARHAVLEARPRSTAEGARAAWETLVERADVPSEREDLRPSQTKPRTCQFTPRGHPP